MSRAASQVGPDDWDQHWRAYAASNRENPAQIYRQKLIFDALALKGSRAPVRLLDLGSGAGELAAHVLRLRPDAEVVGLDLSASGVELASRNVPCARFFQQDFTAPIALDPSYRGWATHAVCSEVLEHLDDPVAMLRNIRACFAPGCRLVITVPAGPLSAFDRHIGHRRHFDGPTLEQTIRSAGLEVPELWGAGFPFFNLYRLSVVARGRALINDVAGKDAHGLPLSARLAMRAFSWLFNLNLDRSRLGWQLVAVGAEPAGERS